MLMQESIMSQAILLCFRLYISETVRQDHAPLLPLGGVLPGVPLGGVPPGPPLGGVPPGPPLGGVPPGAPLGGVPPCPPPVDTVASIASPEDAPPSYAIPLI